MIACLRAAGFQQDHIIRVYESSQGYRVRKNVHARNLRWTITDCDVSPSEAFMVYCSITPTVHMVRLSTPRQTSFRWRCMCHSSAAQLERCGRLHVLVRQTLHQGPRGQHMWGGGQLLHSQWLSGCR